jgi:hypothetical protein
MRTVTPQAQVLLSQNMGTEWIVLLEVDWVDNGTLLYSDQEFGSARPVILEMAGFDGSMMLEGSSDTQELALTLDDVDGHLRAIYNANDIHKRPARVYIQPKSLSSIHKILVFRGEIVTPIEWDEAQRTLRFNVLSKLQEKQVGFSMEEGDFPNIPDEALGKAWPLVFGQVCHLPAVKVRAPRRGYLEGGVGIHDFTLEPRICQAIKIQCPSQSTGNQSNALLGPNGGMTMTVAKTIGPDLECVNRRFGEICKLKDLQTQQMAYEYDTFNVYNGSSFPQGVVTTVFIENAIFKGVFTGNVFSIHQRQHPEYATFNHVPCKNIRTQGYGMVVGRAQIGGTDNTIQGAGGQWILDGTSILNTSATWTPATNGTTFTASQNTAQAFASCEEALVATPGLVGGPKESWEYYDAMEDAGFFWAPAGSEVYIEAESEILYIASLLPGTVDGVAAFRTAPNGFRYLTEVPASYYTVYETDYQGYQVVEIGMNKDLKLYNDQWDDDIYVSFTSSVGPNPCDIIEWLIDRYTDLTVDAASFAAVHALVVNYPNNFYLTDRPDVYKLINDIAYQSRCAVYVRNSVMFIRYLPTEPASVRTLSESDILTGTFQESLSVTEEVYTTHNIKWQKAGAAVQDNEEPERKLVLKYNVDKYGTVAQDWDYYTYNLYDLVLKSATFWLIRKANSWKRVKFSLPLKHMDLDVLDCVTINVAQFSSTPVKCIIETMTIDPNENTVTLDCWTPVRSGETTPYFWAWPAQQPCASVWPLPLDTHGGGGYNFEVTPPVGHLLLGGYHRDDQLIISSGDLHPSDLCDTLPSVRCELSDYINFDEVDPIIEAKQIAQSAARAQVESAISGGGNAGGSGNDKPEPEKQGSCPAGVGCNYNVRVLWHTSTSQGQGDPCGGPCNCSSGCPSCTGPVWAVCHTFGTAWAASMFAKYMQANYGKSVSDRWSCNETGVLQTDGSKGDYVAAGHEEEDCQGYSESKDTPPAAGHASGGETTSPVGDVSSTPSGGDPAQQENTVQINPYTGDPDYRAPGTIANPDAVPPGTVLPDGSIQPQMNPYVE